MAVSKSLATQTAIYQKVLLHNHLLPSTCGPSWLHGLIWMCIDKSFKFARYNFLYITKYDLVIVHCMMKWISSQSHLSATPSAILIDSSNKSYIVDTYNYEITHTYGLPHTYICCLLYCHKCTSYTVCSGFTKYLVIQQLKCNKSPQLSTGPF